jgi:hypothetical protein
MAAPIASVLVAVAGVLTLTASPAAAYSDRSVGTPKQVAWVRRAAGNFLAAELARNGAGACAVLDARLRTERGGVSCERRWDAKLGALLGHRGERSLLREERSRAASAQVLVHGAGATIDLPASLLGGRQANRFTWSENCWMLSG